MTAQRNRRQRKLARPRWATKVVALLGVLLCGALVGAFIFDDMGLSKYLDLRRQTVQLEQEIRGLEASNEALRKEMDRIQHDPARIEELAREQLGLVREGETVYQIVESPDR